MLRLQYLGRKEIIYIFAIMVFLVKIKRKNFQFLVVNRALKFFLSNAGSIIVCAISVMIGGGGLLKAEAGQAILEFDYPTNELPGMTFRAYSTNDVNAPVITWPLLATFVGTNRVLVILPQGINFAVVQASNSLGTSFFSNAAVGILPRTNVVPRFVKP